MQPDDPTTPIMDWRAPALRQSSQAESPLAEFPWQGDHPTWPAATARPTSGRVPRRVPGGSVSAMAFGISLGVNVVLLVALLGVLTLVLSHLGSYLPGGGAGPSAAGLPQSTASVSPSSTVSPTASAGWLHVTPSSVQLSCAEGQRTQYVLLQNSGPDTVRWQVKFSLTTQQAGVNVTPQRGTLAAGASVPLQIQNTSSTSDQQGTISFAPTTTDAGAPTVLSYATAACS